MGRWSDGLPSVNVKESEKNEEWHKKFITGIINDAIDGRYEFSYKLMQESYDFYDGTQGLDEYSFLQETEGGDTLPALWINYNKIRVKVDVLIGELNQAGFDINVRAINKDAQSERLDKKHEILGRMMIRGDLEMLEEQSGIPTGLTQNLPEAKEEVEDFIEKNYKDESEVVMTSAIKYLIKRYKWDYERISLFRDILIAGRCFTKLEIEQGLPKYRRVDPRYMVFDVHSKDDFLSDSTYFGEIEWMSIAKAKEIYDLTKKEIEDIEESTYSNNFLNSLNTNGTQGQAESNLDYTTGSGSGLKVLVFKAEWEDTKTVTRKKSVDRFGNTHYKKVKDGYKGSDKVSKRIKTWRRGVLIGGEVMRDWGLKENMIRSIDNISETKSSYIPLIPNYVNFRSISKVDQLKGLQKMKDITMYNVQVAMARAGAKGFVYDVSLIPDEWEVEDVMKYLKTVGIAFVNSRKDGIPSPTKAFDEFDMTLSNSVGQYLEISRMVDGEMSEISGISEARQGIAGSASQAVGVTQASIMHSNLATNTLFELFRQYTEEVMNQLAGLVKVSWKDREVYSPIIGDAGVNFIENDVDLNLKDYGVLVENLPPTLVDKAELKELVMAALQTQSIEIIDALDLIREKDVDVAINRLKKAIQKREEEKSMQEQEAMAQQEQNKAQTQQQIQQMQFQEKRVDEELKGQRQQKNTMLNGEMKKQQEILKSKLKTIGND